ncbi:MAG: hypothetical protein ACREP6_01825 [Candidatus Binataceae bacterium]
MGEPFRDFKDTGESPLLAIKRRIAEFLSAPIYAGILRELGSNQASFLCLAAEAIERENKTGEAAKIVRDQLARVKPELLKQFRLQTYREFDRVALAGGNVCPLEEQFQVSEEQTASSIRSAVKSRAASSPWPHRAP